MPALLEKYRKIAGTGPNSTITLADWNGLIDELSSTLAGLIKKGADFDAIATVAIGVLLDRINSLLGPAYDQVALRGAQIEALYASLTAAGIPASAVLEGVDRLFLTADRRSSILADIRGGADASADTLAKLAATFANYPRLDVPSAYSAAQQGIGRLNLAAAGQEDLRVLAIQVAKLKGAAAGLFGGVADDLRDQSGLDTVSSVNTFFDAVGNIVANLAIEAAESLPAMTSNSLPSGYVASASTTVNGSYDSYMAFDDNASNAWQASGGAPQWVQRKTPSAIKAAAYALRAFNGANYYPTSWQLQGSNDGTTFTTLDTQSGIVFATGERKVFPVPIAAQGAYTYYRLNVTGMNYTSVIVAEMEILQGSTAVLDLRSTAFTAQAVPSKASIFALVKATAGTITPGTNLVASISRDGGTTYTPFTLTQTGMLGGFAIYEANGLDISGQPPGTSMKWRLQTTGAALGIAVDAVVAQWG